MPRDRPEFTDVSSHPVPSDHRTIAPARMLEWRNPNPLISL